MRTGRTGNFAVRTAQHARNAATKDLIFEPIYRTDVYAEQRGLEQELDWQYDPPLNKINPINPESCSLTNYLHAANDFLDNLYGTTQP